uniref:DNA/RNA-binding protein Kin17 WH-like domain-containing protein n=1 Tax=Chrysotila carterae TaxID=13221 RepID=A0A6S9VCW8_CHRCT
MSESHQRQMSMFTENSGAFMDEFSKEFEAGMMEIIARKARSHRCSANVIYREYISDRNHFHMNSTIWETLTDFVMYLGRTGKCEVDETEKGWFVTYIDRDPETLRRLEARAKRERSELDSEEKHQRDLERQVKIARSLEGGGQPPAPTELKRADPSEKVAFGIPASSKPAAAKAKLPSCALFSADEAPVDTAPSSASASSSALPAGAKSRTSGIQALIAEDMKRKEASARSKYWLRTDIVVKARPRAPPDAHAGARSRTQHARTRTHTHALARTREHFHASIRTRTHARIYSHARTRTHARAHARAHTPTRLRAPGTLALSRSLQRTPARIDARMRPGS